MKGIFVTALVLVTLFLLAQGSFAQEVTSEEAKAIAGTTPDSVFYGIDVAFDRLSLFLRFDDESKAKKGLQIAGERLFEAKVMIDEEKVEAAQRAEAEHEDALSRVRVSVESLRRANSTEEIRDILEIRKELQAHERNVERVNDDLKIKIRTEGRLTEEQKARLNSLLDSVSDGARKLQVEIRNKEGMTKIKIKQETGKTEVEIEKEIDDIKKGISLEDEREVEDGETRVRAEILGNATEARVEVEFDSNMVDKAAIAGEILNKLKLSRENISRLLRIEAEGDDFVANLSGSGEVPPVMTAAQGKADLNLRRNATELQFRLRVAAIENATAAHIHLAPAGKNGPVVVTLFPGPKKEGTFSGILAEGVATASDLSVPLAGQPMSALLDKMRAGEAYVNVHTDKYPAGEIRGQIMPERDAEIRERLEAEVKVEKGATEAKAEFRFPLAATTRDAIIEGIFQKLSALTINDILAVLDFEADDIRERPVEVQAEIIGNAVEVKVRSKFDSNTTEKNAIAGEMLSRIKLDMPAISRLLKIQDQEPGEELRERLRAESKVEGGISKNEIEFKFPINTTSRDVIVGETFRKLSALTASDVLNALEFEAKDKNGGQICIQVITPAVSKSGECKEFPTPCDVPADWIKVPSCPAQVVEIDSSGFKPSTLDIAAGQTVVFLNEDNALHWPASAPHPVHTDYPGFDAKKGLAKDESFVFTFDRAGSWKYHDHLNCCADARFFGTINVQ